MKPKNSLFYTLLIYFAIVVVAFAALVGVIYTQIYSDISMDSYRKQLSQQAENIAERVSEFVQDGDFTAYPSFLEVLEELETSDIWIMANPEDPMDERYANMSSDIALPELDPVLSEVFGGKIGSISIYSETYEASYVFVGAPIILEDGSVVGAVLVNSLAELQHEIISQSIKVVVASVIVALIISTSIAFLLAGKIAKPITRMRNTALTLSNEDYSVRTGIEMKGEIGELASSLDILAGRLEKSEEDRRNMEQMRQDFFANVSHELRTPITVMRAYTETLVDGVVTDEDKKMQYYEKMLIECKSMQRLVGDLLLLSKMQNPDFKIEKEPVSLLQVFDDILRSAGAIASEKGVSITTERNLSDEGDPDEICLIDGDYDRLRQMFMVIVDNAIKFSNEGGNVEIVFTESAEELKVSIRDHGTGISAEELPYIFDKFYKSKLRQNAKGTGLGLAIARQICLKHDGSIDVKSEPGQGTEFTFKFARLHDYSES